MRCCRMAEGRKLVGWNATIIGMSDITGSNVMR